MAESKIKYSDIAEKDLFQPAIESANKLIAVLDDLESKFKEILKASNGIAQSKPLDSYKNIKEVEKAIEDVSEATKQLTAIEKEREKLQAKLIDLQSEQIKENAQLRVQIQEQTRANKEAAKEVLGLNSIYQQQSKRLNDLRKQYKELALSEKGATKEAKALLKEIQELDSTLKDLDDRVGQNFREVGSYQKALKGLQERMDKFKQTATGAFVFTGIGAALSAVNALSGAFKSSTVGTNAFEKGLARVTVTLNVFVGTLIAAFQKSDGFFNFFEQLQKEFEGFEERVTKAIEAQDKAIDTNTKYAESIVSISAQIAKLRKEQANLQVVADDNTLSFAEQTQSGNDLLIVNEKLSQSELQLVNMRLKAVAERRKASKEAGVINAEIEQEYADLLLEQADKQAELAERQGATNRKLREDARDEAELRLDLLIDTFDRQKTINERQIADETINFEKRRALLLETQRLADKSFAEQVATVQEFTDIQIDANALVAESDASVIDAQIRQLGLSEILRNRLREIIQERKTGIQDLTEAQKSLERTEINELRASVALQQEALQALQERGANLVLIQKRLAEKTLQQEIENTLQRLAFVEKGSEEELRLKKELNDKLIQQQENRLQKEKENEEKFRQAGLAALRSFNEKREAEITSRIDDELQANQQRQQQLIAIAENGSEDVLNNLALEQKRQAELELERERALKRKQRTELALSAIETYSAKVQAGDENALASTISDVAVLQAFIASLPTFFGGAENVADALGAPDVAGKDGYIIRVDGGERVLNNAHSAMIPKSITNFELATMANLYSKGRLKPAEDASNDIDRVVKAIENKPVYLGREYDATEKAIIDVIHEKGRIERNRKKVGKLF